MALLFHTLLKKETLRVLLNSSLGKGHTSAAQRNSDVDSGISEIQIPRKEKEVREQP